MWRNILIGVGLELNSSISIVMVGYRTIVGYYESISVVSVGNEFRSHCVQDVKINSHAV